MTIKEYAMANRLSAEEIGTVYGNKKFIDALDSATDEMNARIEAQNKQKKVN